MGALIPPPIAPPPNFLVRPPFFIGGAPAPAARAFSSAATRGSTPAEAPCAAAILARMSAAMRGSTAGAAAGAPRPAIILARSSAATRGSTPPAPIIGPPSIFLVRPPAFMPPTCFGPSRYSLAFFLSALMNRSTGGISALPPALRGLRSARTSAFSPSAWPRWCLSFTFTLPPRLYWRLEMGRMPVWTPAPSSVGSVHPEASTAPLWGSARRWALLLSARRAFLEASDMAVVLLTGGAACDYGRQTKRGRYYHNDHQAPAFQFHA